MQGHQAAIDGHQVMVADAIDLHTWDDVEDPAVDGAGQFVLLADSVMTHLTDDMATKPGRACAYRRMACGRRWNYLGFYISALH
jgi:hypothetical protein